MRHRRSVLFRGLCLLAMTAFLLGGVLEPALGLLRDGQVHHEATAAAGVHGQLTASGEHGHEDGSSKGPGHSHAPDHQHGTSGDHCTHAHGIGMTSAHAVEFMAVIEGVGDMFVPMTLPAPHQVHSPPPRV